MQLFLKSWWWCLVRTDKMMMISGCKWWWNLMRDWCGRKGDLKGEGTRGIGLSVEKSEHGYGFIESVQYTLLPISIEYWTWECIGISGNQNQPNATSLQYSTASNGYNQVACSMFRPANCVECMSNEHRSRVFPRTPVGTRVSWGSSINWKWHHSAPIWVTRGIRKLSIRALRR